ncbi:NAD(P)H-hydrate dehydratase [Aquabacterium sp.]|uniref:NAD(P)H-hydrate dehydratase n=1 Tax=Aquabacterium sp. TaxID=1872578 RepID=UPI003783DB74
MIEDVLPPMQRRPLFGVAASRRLEQDALARTEPFALMAAAGFSAARLALAIAPHARTVWVAAGPGNNGGDGLVAARHLVQAGKAVRLSLLGDAAALPHDARQALDQAQQAGIQIESGLPERIESELAIDALLGLGARRAPQGPITAAIALLNAQPSPVLAIDLPSGLSSDCGMPLGAEAVRAAHTLTLLSLKPGLFTAQGRDHAGRIWFDDLGTDPVSVSPDAWLGGPPVLPARRHAHHKGSFGDVLVIGGGPGMGGAALLAARAALSAGAGRVYLARLDEGEAHAVDMLRPELMPRSVAEALAMESLRAATVVCGCGGGDRVREVLPSVLHHAGRLVLDADALNSIAADPALTHMVSVRADRGQFTLLTPHPLEAARLLNCSSAEVQADRLASARRLANQLRVTVVLKGSGSVIASPQQVPVVNATGNARLGTAGSGDVLAGWSGGLWAQHSDCAAQAIAEQSVWLHGRAAEVGDPRLPLLAADLIERLPQALPPPLAAR